MVTFREKSEVKRIKKRINNLAKAVAQNPQNLQENNENEDKNMDVLDGVNQVFII